MGASIDVQKLQAICGQHERLRSDYGSRAEDVREAARTVATLRGELAQATTSEAALALIQSNPAELLNVEPDKLAASNIDLRSVRKLLAAQATLAEARREADAQAVRVRESAALVERLNAYASRFREAA